MAMFRSIKKPISSYLTSRISYLASRMTHHTVTNSSVGRIVNCLDRLHSKDKHIGRDGFSHIVDCSVNSSAMTIRGPNGVFRVALFVVNMG